jgi:hypothetical protein
MKNTNSISNVRRSGYRRISGWLLLLLSSFIISDCSTGRSLRYTPPGGVIPWRFDIVAVHSWEGDCNAGYDLFIDGYGITEIAWDSESLREQGTQSSTGDFGGVPVTLTVIRRIEEDAGSRNRCHDLLDITVDRRQVARFAF